VAVGCQNGKSKPILPCRDRVGSREHLVTLRFCKQTTGEISGVATARNKAVAFTTELDRRGETCLVLTIDAAKLL